MIIPQINILCVVDVIGVLKAQTLTGNFYMMDNSRSVHTTGQGTANLSSAVSFGQVINWHVMPIDVQTDIQISRIRFEGSKPEIPCGKMKNYGAPSGDYWAGIVNLQSEMQGGIYRYKMMFDMGRRLMEMESYATINVANRVESELLK